MSKVIVPPRPLQVQEKANALHAEIEEGFEAAVRKAIACGEILSRQKEACNHGQWRPWVKENLAFSYRSAARYMVMWANRERIKDAKSIREAQAILTEKEKGHDAITADYRRIRKDVLKPVKVARKRLEKMEYVGDDAEELEEIKEELKAEVEELSLLLGDL